MPIPQHICIGWPSTAGTIPSGWTRVTAADGRHIKSIPTSSTAPGTTGGNAQHHHTTNDHTHTISHTHATANLANSTGTVAVASAGSVDTNADAHTHATGTISATTGTTEATNHPDSDDQNNDPAYWATIWIESNGTPTTIPEGAITFFNNATLPPSWTQPANGKLKFPRGAAAAGDGGGTGGGGSHTHAGGSHTHSSDHVHPDATAAATATNTSESAGTLAASDAHTHVVTVPTANFGTSNAGTYATSGTATPAPPWVKLAVITPPSGGDVVQGGIIALWLESLATIPGDWVLCDGNNGTPDLCQGLFVMGCDALTELLNTGGSATHTHTAGTAHTHTWTSSAHTHTVTVAASSAARGLTGSTSTKATVSHAHADSNSGAANALTVGTASPNPSMLAADHSPLFIEAAFIQSTPPATPKDVVVPADAWENLADSVFGGLRRIGWLDSVTFDKQTAGATTPKTASPPADGLNNWTDNLRHSKNFNLTGDSMTMADQPPTVSRFGFLTATPPADSLGLYADQPPTISKLGFLSAVPPADGLANYADSISGLGRAYNLTGDSLSLQDQPPTVLRTGYLSAALPADARPALVDQGDITYGKRYDTPADSLNQWLDSPTVEVKVSTLTVSLPPDSLNQWADDRTVDKQVVGSNPIDVNVPADSLNNWLDSPSKFQFGFIQATPPADSLNLWVDSANAFETIAARPGDDLLNNWADDKTVSKPDIGTTPINVTLPADSLNNWVDSAASVRRRAGWYDVVVFNLESLAGAISVSRTDALANYADTLASRSDLLVGRVVYLVDGDGNFIVDENGNKIVIDGLIDNLAFADSAAKTLATIGVTPINVALPADGLNLWADSPTTARFGYLQIAPPVDSLANYVDALRHSKNFNLTDNLNNWVDAPAKDLQIVGSNPITVTPPADGLNLWADSPTKTQFGYLQVTPPADSLANYADELRHSKNFNLTDNLNQWADAPAKDLQIVGSNPITVTPPADGLNQWADSPSTAQFGYRQVVVPADNLNQWFDSATTAKFGYLNASTPVDNFNAWADSYQHGKGYSLPVDTFNQWADSTSVNLQTVTLTVALTDSLNLWADAVVAGFGGQKFVQLTDAKPDFVDTVTTSGRAFYQLTLADNLGGYADAAPTTFATLAVKPPADPRGAFVDSVEAVKYLAILKTLTDANVVYSDSATALVNGLVGLGPDSLLNYADSLNLFADLRTAPSGDGLANYLDSIASEASLFVALSDAMTVIDALAVGLGPFDEVILVLDLVSEIVRVIEIEAEIKHAIEVESEIVPSVDLFWEVTA